MLLVIVLRWVLRGGAGVGILRIVRGAIVVVGFTRGGLALSGIV